MIDNDLIVNNNDLLLVTGSNGFIGAKVVETLLSHGFNNIRCFVRPSSNLTNLERIINSYANNSVEVFKGNLLSLTDCKKSTDGVSVIFHLAAKSVKSFPECFRNCVVTTKRLLDSTVESKTLKRFLNVSSFIVYSNMKMKRGGLLDETCEVESNLRERFHPYCFAKIKQEELVTEYSKRYDIPCVIVRPGAVYGPNMKQLITSRVGIDTFGIFLHLGGPNRIPLTYVDNCADAIVLAGIKKNINGEILNIVDDDLPTSRKFLRMYKKNVGHFKSIYVPFRMFYILSYFWEKYSTWSEGQLPPVFNRRKSATLWKGNRYSNKKLKRLTGWKPKVSTNEGLKRYFEFARTRKLENINA